LAETGLRQIEDKKEAMFALVVWRGGKENEKVSKVGLRLKVYRYQKPKVVDQRENRHQ